MLHMSKTIPPPLKPSRVSVPVSSEVLEVFQHLADAGRTSVGRAMADWLADTIEAAAYMAEKIRQARSAPATVARELHAYAQAMEEQTLEVMLSIEQKGKAHRAASAAQPLRPSASHARVNPYPPPCNTGGKLAEGKQKNNLRGLS